MGHPALMGRTRNSRVDRGRSRTVGPTDVYIAPYHLDVVPWSSWDTDGSATPVRTQTSSALGMGYQSQSTGTADDGDYIEWYVNLAAGTYTFTTIYATSTTFAILAFTLDGVSMGATVDGYAASLTLNNVAQRTGVTVSTAGLHTLRMTATGKNASSTDYVMSPQSFNFVRTGA